MPSMNLPMTDIVYGAFRRSDWPLDPMLTYLNHGGYGVTPHAVLAAQTRWRTAIEANPNGFVRDRLAEALRDAKAPVVRFIGADAEDVAFIDNATTGCNAVLRSLAFAPGDEILLLSLAYPAIKNAVRHVAAYTGAVVVEVDIPLPLTEPAAVVDAVSARLSRRTRLAIFDHVASHSALIMPVADLTGLVHAAGGRVLIDGAHVPGMLPLNVPALGADWYVGNLHKWLFAPRACGFLWAGPAAREGLHPPVISVGLGQGFQAEFGWTGTRDPSNFLSAPDGIAFFEALGGPALMERNRTLAQTAADYLAGAWHTVLGGPLGSFGAMATVRLPVDGPVDGVRASAIQRLLSREHRIEVAIHDSGGYLWLRVALQAYNDMADIERLAAALLPSLRRR